MTDTGKRAVVFNVRRGYADRPISIPCGQCIGCRLERSRQWAIRCVHESSLYEENCFLTLTYDDDHLPMNRSLDIRDFQKFMKRLRKTHGAGIRFFHCGEYGENFGRPHYHACVFNFDFGDKQPWKTTQENSLHTSEELQRLWPFGFSSVGAVTFQSAAYVARYITKKITGPGSVAHYEYVSDDGEVFDRSPEYTTMSRRPGIGKGWLDQYRTDIYPGDFVVLNNVKMKPPKFYDRQLEVEYPTDYARLRSARIIDGKKHADNNTKDRRAVREKVQESRLEMLRRPLE